MPFDCILCARAPCFGASPRLDGALFLRIFFSIPPLIIVPFSMRLILFTRDNHWWGRSGRGGFSQPASQPKRRNQPASQPAKAAESASQPHNAAESASQPARQPTRRNQPASQPRRRNQPASQPRRRNQRASEGSGTIRANMAMACIDMDVGRCE